MTVTVTTPDELEAFFDNWMKTVVDEAVAEVQREVTVYCFQKWTSGKYTWSKFNPADVWSGQARESVNVSIGAPDASYAPPRPSELWPMHENPYPPRDVFEALWRLDALKPYVVTYVSDSAPHYDKVEAHTRIGHAAFELTKSHFSNYNWQGVVQGRKSTGEVPF